VLDCTELCDRFWYLLWDGLQLHDVYENFSFGSDFFLSSCECRLRFENGTVRKMGLGFRNFQSGRN